MANPLTASLTDNNATLVWYGTNATGGTGSTTATVPSTANAGTFTYYVAQKLNDCESERTAITVEVKAGAPAPTVADVSYCQGAQAGPLSATTASGGSLLWYTASSGGAGATVAPTPNTTNAGTFSYYVTQSLNGGCEGARTEVKAIVKATPVSPTVSNIAVCQNAAPALTAVGQNLKWYSSADGGTGASTAPTINSGQPSTSTYYVSQTVDGCESPRSTLSVTVKPQPAAPGVTLTSACQFASPQPPSATGQNLKWYNPDGTFSNTAPVPTTNQGASYTYAVSQTVDGCESPRATATVVVQVTPAPTVTSATVELCQGATAQPLVAQGTNLKWTDPNGVVSTTAPSPSTANPTKAEGNVYSVTQTGSNGCESPSVQIRVFVQTAPTLLLSGTTTVNLGQEAPLKLTFTGVGPYRFTLSDGVARTATKDTTISVLPTQTTTYQVVNVANKCGTGSAGPRVVITVTVPTIRTLALSSTTLCAGTSFTTSYATTGSFNSGNVFKLQIAPVVADSMKASFVDIATSLPTNGQLTGNLPTTVAGGAYWVRVAATNPKIPINGTISSTVLTIRSLATATLTGTQSIYEGASAILSVAFTGDGPWTFTYRDSTANGLGTVQTVATNANPHTLSVQPAKTTAYQLLSVSNNCGSGAKAAGTATVSVLPVLGVEDPSLPEALDVFPVPVTSVLTVRINGLRPTETATLELTDLTGRTTLYQQTHQVTTVLLLNEHPAGTYLLRVRVSDRRAIRRILKH